MSKKNQTFLETFLESLKLYFSHFEKFTKYMTFPVLGQIVGLALVFFLAHIFSKNIQVLILKIPALNDFSVMLFVLFAIILPGLLIFMKSFWEYLIAYGAINSMLENMLKSGKVYDFDAHTELIKRRTIPFIGLWFLVGMFSIVTIIPFFWVPCGVLAVYLVLIFQVFTFEPELSPVACLKKSFQLIKGHFLQTFLLITLVGTLTYIIIPNLATLFFEYTNFTKFLVNLVTPLISELPISELNRGLQYLYIPPLKIEAVSNFMITLLISQIFIQYTLPLRSILWGLWYRRLQGSLPKTVEKKKKYTSSKKPSQKLMEESHKKFTSKKLDRNLLKRAMEKDE